MTQDTDKNILSTNFIKKMKKKLSIILAGFAMLVACNKNGDDVVKTIPADAQLILNIAGITAPAKAEISVYQTTEEKKISVLNLAVYRPDPNKGYVYEWSKSFPEAGSNYIISGLIAGDKTVVALANADIPSFPETLDGFLALKSNLKENAADKLVMTGSVTCKAGTEPEAATLSLNRIAAKFLVDGDIKTDWIDGGNHEFDIQTIYLANVTTEANYLYVGDEPSLNLRKDMEYTSDGGYKTLTVAEKVSWTPGQKFNGGVVFFGYPNASNKKVTVGEEQRGDTRTAVLIKATYDGKTCWYPLKIDQEIKNNTLYRIGDITITCEGVPNPWNDFNRIMVKYSIEVVDWTYNNIYPEFEF